MEDNIKEGTVIKVLDNEFKDCIGIVRNVIGNSLCVLDIHGFPTPICTTINNIEKIDDNNVDLNNVELVEWLNKLSGNMKVLPKEFINSIIKK